MFELINTSVPSGLIAGTRGFTTVAMTPKMPLPLQRTCDSLAAYSFRVTTNNQSYFTENPTNYFHYILSQGEHVIGSVKPCAFDYTGRTNRLAHFFVFGKNEFYENENAADLIFANHETFTADWNANPGYIEKDTQLYQSNSSATTKHWRDFFGDFGDAWCRAVADDLEMRIRQKANKALYFKFSAHGGAVAESLISLFSDLISLLPEDIRSHVTFSTYATNVPAGTICHLSGICDDSPALKASSESSAWIDCINRKVVNEHLLIKKPIAVKMVSAGRIAAPERVKVEKFDAKRFCGANRLDRNTQMTYRDMLNANKGKRSDSSVYIFIGLTALVCLTIVIAAVMYVRPWETKVLVKTDNQVPEVMPLAESDDKPSTPLAEEIMEEKPKTDNSEEEAKKKAEEEKIKEKIAKEAEEKRVKAEEAKRACEEELARKKKEDEDARNPFMSCKTVYSDRQKFADAVMEGCSSNVNVLAWYIDENKSLTNKTVVVRRTFIGKDSQNCVSFKDDDPFAFLYDEKSKSGWVVLGKHIPLVAKTVSLKAGEKVEVCMIDEIISSNAEIKTFIEDHRESLSGILNKSVMVKYKAEESFEEYKDESFTITNKIDLVKVALSIKEEKKKKYKEENNVIQEKVDKLKKESALIDEEIKNIKSEVENKKNETLEKCKEYNELKKKNKKVKPDKNNNSQKWEEDKPKEIIKKNIEFLINRLDFPKTTNAKSIPYTNEDALKKWFEKDVNKEIKNFEKKKKGEKIKLEAEISDKKSKILSDTEIERLLKKYDKFEFNVMVKELGK